MILHIAEDHLRCGGFARATDGDVADADDGDGEALALKKTTIEHPMAKGDRHSIGIR